MRVHLRWALPLLALPFILLLAFGLSRDTFVLPSPLEGGPAPPFKLETFAGDSLDLTDLRGHVVLVNFWASWCIPCRVEHPVLLEIEARYDTSSVVILGVSYQDSRENASRFMRLMGGDWDLLVDPGSHTAIDYGVYGVPESFFLDQEGRVAKKQVGPISWELASSTIDSLLAATPDAVTRRAVGPAGGPTP